MKDLKAIYERTWKAFINSPVWETPLDKRSPHQKADLDLLAEACHDAYWRYRDGMSGPQQSH